MKKRFSDFLAPLLLKWLIIALMMTCRKKWLGREHTEQLRKAKRNWIYSAWHNNISCAVYLLRRKKLLAIVSSSHDGMIASKIIEHFGNETIRGSSSKGGAKVLLSMIKGLKAGKIGAITPDGPRGPKYYLQGGIISIGQKSKVPLIPLHIEATRQWTFNKSWDQHKLPKPFSTVVVGVGKPFEVPFKMDREELELVRIQFEKAMLENVHHVENKIKSIRQKDEI